MKIYIGLYLFPVGDIYTYTQTNMLASFCILPKQKKEDKSIGPEPTDKRFNYGL